MPEGTAAPSAAPVAAPSAPVSSPAPVSTPSPAPVSTPASTDLGTGTGPGNGTPVDSSTAVAPPAGGDGSGLPATTDAPVVPAATEKPAPPKPEDFGTDQDGMEEYLQAKWKYEDEHGPIEGDKPAEVPAAEVATDAPAEGEKPKAPDAPIADVTPESLASLFESNPERKAFIDADPELKGQLFAMARTNAKFAPVAEIFPNVESAKFASETANQFVELQSAFQMSTEDPENFTTAFDKFQDLFRLKDDKGEYKKDAQGNIMVGEDFNMLADHMVGGYFKSESTSYKQKAADLKQKLENSVYPNEAAKTADADALDQAEAAVMAFEFIEGLKANGGEVKPDLSKIADPATRAYYEKREAELAEGLKKLGLDKTAGAKTATKEARTKFENEYRGNFGGQVGKRIGDLIKQKLDAGTFIPSYVLNDKDPKSGAATIAIKILDAFEKKINGIASIKNHQATLQMLKPGPESMKQRLDYNAQLVEEFLPSIIDSYVGQVQATERKDRESRATSTEAREKVVQREPMTGGSAPTTPVMTDAQISAQAKENVAKLSGYDSMEPKDRMSAELAEEFRLKYSR